MTAIRFSVAIGVGLIGTMSIAIGTYFNDHILKNTYLIGSYFPVSVTLWIMALTFVINLPLRLIRPAIALNAAQLLVVLVMLLSACAIPGSGLMRYLPSSLIGTKLAIAERPEAVAVFAQSRINPAVFPHGESTDWDAAVNDPVITNFVTNTPGDSTSQSWIEVVPWSAWLRVAVVWMIPLASAYVAIVALAIITRAQFADTERLPFPLAGLYLSLIEPPEPGRLLNRMFRARSFWLAFASVALLHAMNGLHEYNGRLPAISLQYNHSGLLSEWPLNAVESHVASAKIYFVVVGTAFFVQSRVAVSIWFFMIGFQVVQVVCKSAGVEQITPNAAGDQLLGAFSVFAACSVWIGRQAWLDVVRRVLGRRVETDEPLALAGWSLIVGVVIMTGWLVWAGVGLGSAICIVLISLTIFLVVARIVAETGLPLMQMPLFPSHFFQFVSTTTGLKVSTGSFFFSQLVGGVFTHDTRESVAGFTSTALQVRTGQPMISVRRAVLTMIVASFLALTVSFMATLVLEYRHPFTLGGTAEVPNRYALETIPRGGLVDRVMPYAGLSSSNQAHSSATHFAIGGGTVALLFFLGLRFGGWPLSPIGMLILHTYPARMLWFSVLIGWLFRQLIIYLGGATAYRNARFVFFGLMLGECFAAGLWMCVNLILFQLGIEYRPIQLLPS
jgi:hypothetical protein